MKPIQAGDTAEIIEGALGTKGPNVGKTVRVVSLRGEHSEYGCWRRFKIEPPCRLNFEPGLLTSL